MVAGVKVRAKIVKIDSVDEARLGCLDAHRRLCPPLMRATPDAWTKVKSSAPARVPPVLDSCEWKLFSM